MKSILEDKKGRDIEAISLEGKTTLADYFIIATGGSMPHIRALADELQFQMKSRYGIVPDHTEGYEGGRWILLDYLDNRRPCLSRRRPRVLQSRKALGGPKALRPPFFAPRVFGRFCRWQPHPVPIGSRYDYQTDSHRRKSCRKRIGSVLSPLPYWSFSRSSLWARSCSAGCLAAHAAMTILTHGPSGSTVPAGTTATSEPVRIPVYLVGAVARPGIYEVVPGTYLFELVELARRIDAAGRRRPDQPRLPGSRTAGF